MLAGNNGSHALNAISPVELRDCIISANRCDSAVRVSSEFKIGGAMTICGNVNADGKNSNLELREGRTVTIAEPLSEYSNICVSTEAVPTIGNPINITGANGEDYSAYFHSDNEEYKIINGENNVVQLTEVNPKTYVPIHDKFTKARFRERRGIRRNTDRHELYSGHGRYQGRRPQRTGLLYRRGIRRKRRTRQS